MKFLDFIGGLLEARMSDMNKMNGQSFTAQKLGLKILAREWNIIRRQSQTFIRSGYWAGQDGSGQYPYL
jgi:hypothetical protein